jgi:GTP cyclohydrolase III
MADSGKPVLKTMIRGCSRLLVLAGAVAFFVGDRFLHEIMHVDSLVSEVVSIVGGVLLVAVGAGIGMLGKSPKN